MSKFKQAISWILHSEELDEVQDRFSMTDQQMEDAVGVVEMIEKIALKTDEDFDLLNEIHTWSKKEPW
tara:strand:- start:370 stop:573 length:204 start_codon:yes stop_codon:yes gene_type:complete